MRMWLCNRKFTTVGEVLTKPLTASQVSSLFWGVEGGKCNSKDKLINTACKFLGIEESQMRMWVYKLGRSLQNLLQLARYVVYFGEWRRKM